jgi:putative ABC transport system ATP-binding protein
MNAIINVDKLSKSFGEVEIISDVSFSILKGEFVSIMGRSGSGKSTLLYNVSGMDRPTSGKVEFLGQDIATLNDKQLSDIRLNHMGFIFQHAYLLKKLTIKDNICLPGYKSAVQSKAEVEQLADKLMQMTDISHIGQNDIKKVSGGQLQRASICRALINNPEVLFADEPTGALNSSATEEIMQIINQINKNGTTVIMVTHDTKVASVAERIIFIKDGKLHDELMLGKFDGDKMGHANREKTLMQWLENKGF